LPCFPLALVKLNDPVLKVSIVRETYIATNTILTKYMSPDTLFIHEHELISQYYVLRCSCSIVFCNYKCIYLFKQNWDLVCLVKLYVKYQYFRNSRHTLLARLLVHVLLNYMKNTDTLEIQDIHCNVCLEFLKYLYFTYSLTRHVLTTSLVMCVLNYYKTKVYVYLNLDKTSTNNLASNVCLSTCLVHI
jgi:hypothetical protein